MHAGVKALATLRRGECYWIKLARPRSDQASSFVVQSHAKDPTDGIGPKPNELARAAVGEEEANGGKNDCADALGPKALLRQCAQQEIEAGPEHQTQMATQDGDSPTDIAEQAV